MSEEKKTHPEHKYSITFGSKVGTKKTAFREDDIPRTKQNFAKFSISPFAHFHQSMKTPHETKGKQDCS